MCLALRKQSAAMVSVMFDVPTEGMLPPPTR